MNIINHHENILIYLDGSDESYVSAQYSIYLAKTYKITLTGVFAINNLDVKRLLRKSILLPQEKDAYIANLLKDLKKYQQQLKSMASTKQVNVDIITIHEEKDPEKAIVDLIKERKISTLVLGALPAKTSRNHNSSNLSKELIYASPCSILIVKNALDVQELFNSI